jgi:hypothetical protein
LLLGKKVTSPIACPITKTRVWSAIVAGEVRKKKARVMWKRESEVMIVEEEITAMMLSMGCFDLDFLLQYPYRRRGEPRVKL